MSTPNKNLPKLFPDPEQDDRSTHAHRQLIGYIGVGLPLLLWLIAGSRPMGEFPWNLLDSISAYYYSGAVSVFAGMLFALSIYFFSYEGYRNQSYLRDRIAALIAGSAALLVALFPVGASAPPLALPWWTPPIGTIHFASATVLFSSFIFFCLWQFPQSAGKKPLSRGKKARNLVYRVCGVAIIFCMAWAVYANFTNRPIFLPEALSLEFFGISWLVKGRAYKTIPAAGRLALHYAVHPQEAVKDAKKAIEDRQGIRPSSSAKPFAKHPGKAVSTKKSSKSQSKL